MFKRYLLLFTLIYLIVELNVSAQRSYKDLYQEKCAACDSIIPDSLIPEIRQELSQLENYLVTTGFFPDRSPDSYYNVYKKIKADGNLILDLNIHLKTFDSLMSPMLGFCLFKVIPPSDSIKVSADLLNRLRQMKENLPNDINPEKATTLFLNYLNPSDFKYAFLRYRTLFSIYSTAVTEDEYELIHSKKSSSFQGPRLIITILGKDKFSLEGKVKKIKKALKRINKFIERDPQHYVIELHSSQTTPYSTYLNILEEIQKQVKDLRNNYSLKQYQTPFGNLKYDQKNQIVKKFPIRIQIEESTKD